MPSQNKKDLLRDLSVQSGFLLDAKLSLDGITSKLIQARSAL